MATIIGPWTSRGLCAELAKFIDLPPRATAIEIRMAVDELTTVKVTYYPELKTHSEPITKRFMLEEIPDPGLRTAHPQEGPKT